MWVEQYKKIDGIILKVVCLARTPRIVFLPEKKGEGKLKGDLLSRKTERME